MNDEPIEVENADSIANPPRPRKGVFSLFGVGLRRAVAGDQ